MVSVSGAGGGYDPSIVSSSYSTPPSTLSNSTISPISQADLQAPTQPSVPLSPMINNIYNLIQEYKSGTLTIPSVIPGGTAKTVPTSELTNSELKDMLAPLLATVGTSTTNTNGSALQQVSVNGVGMPISSALIQNIDSILDSGSPSSPPSSTNYNNLLSNLATLSAQNVAVSPDDLANNLSNSLETLSGYVSTSSDSGYFSSLGSTLQMLTNMSSAFGSSFSTMMNNMNNYYDEQMGQDNTKGTTFAVMAHFASMSLNAVMEGQTLAPTSSNTLTTSDVLNQIPENLTFGQAQGLMSLFLASASATNSEAGFSGWEGCLSNLASLAQQLKASPSTVLSPEQRQDFVNLISKQLGSGSSFSSSLISDQLFMQAGSLTAASIGDTQPDLASGILLGVSIAANNAALTPNTVSTNYQQIYNTIAQSATTNAQILDGLGTASTFDNTTTNITYTRATAAGSAAVLYDNISNLNGASSNPAGDIPLSQIFSTAQTNIQDIESKYGNLSSAQLTQVLQGFMGGLAPYLNMEDAIGGNTTAIGGLNDVLYDTGMSNSERIKLFAANLGQLSESSSSETASFSTVRAFSTTLVGALTNGSQDSTTNFGMMLATQSVLSNATTTTSVDPNMTSYTNLYNQITSNIGATMLSGGQMSQATQSMIHLIPILSGNMEQVSGDMQARYPTGAYGHTAVARNVEVGSALSLFIQNATNESNGYASLSNWSDRKEGIISVLSQVQGLSSDPLSSQIGGIIAKLQSSTITQQQAYQALGPIMSSTANIPFSSIVAIGQNALRGIAADGATNPGYSQAMGQFANSLLSVDNGANFQTTGSGAQQNANLTLALSQLDPSGFSNAENMFLGRVCVSSYESLSEMIGNMNNYPNIQD